MINQIKKKKGFSNYLKTKIVATIGPASSNETTLQRMIKHGMSVARLNFSHGSYDDHLKTIKSIRNISNSLNMPVAILQDLCGPKIRLSKMDIPVELKKGKTITLAADNSLKADLYTDFMELPQLVEPSDTILIDDGYIELKALSVDTNAITCRVMVPGLAKSRKGINLPDTSVSIPVFTKKDKEDLVFGLAQGIDVVAVSFVESAENIIPIREMMKTYAHDRDIPIIAKIERPTALKNIEKILEAFDGIMIARGDLGVEIPPEEVPVIQKKLINMANDRNKLVITATQMLESMISNPRPTRAEASDVSNAILDGTDAVMLSGETAAGKYPVESVKMMKRIALTTENSQLYQYAIERKKDFFSHTEAIVKSASEVADDLKAKAILVFTRSGNTALLLSQYRPRCPILAFTPHEDTVMKMAAYWGVSPYFIEFVAHTDEMILKGEEYAREKGMVKPGDLVITVAGVTLMKGATNMLRVSVIGKEKP
jgi:pyruvate kinase